MASMSRKSFLILGIALVPVCVNPPNAESLAEESQSLSKPNEVLKEALKKAYSKGKSGAAAGVVQVLSLMWLRTTMNYQYRNGGSTIDSLKILYKDGGVPRLYKGLPFAIIQSPLSRFGDTAANAGVVALLEAYPLTSSLPMPIKSAGGSIVAGIWRIFLTPIDSFKTALQVGGDAGNEIIMKRIKLEGPSALYQGALASAVATIVGHFPWYLTYNTLSEKIPAASDDDLLLQLLRAAFIGFCASTVSDCCSNSLRVLKTTKQTSEKQISYLETFQIVIEKDGIGGLFGRGLQTRLVVNGMQGSLFSVLWKLFQR